MHALHEVIHQLSTMVNRWRGPVLSYVFTGSKEGSRDCSTSPIFKYDRKTVMNSLSTRNNRMEGASFYGCRGNVGFDCAWKRFSSYTLRVPASAWLGELR